ncbi:MAG: ATP-binding protein [Spirochaetota bacterium]
MTDHFEFLRNVYFFRDLKDHEIQRIAELCEETEFRPGDIIVQEGTPGDKFFIVLSGQVEVWQSYDKGTGDLLAVHGPGHLFGEMALVDEEPRSASVVARTAGHMLFLTREQFHEVLTESPSVALSVTRSLSAMVRKSNQSYVERLRSRNRQLEEAYRNLQEAQEELLRAERLSNLGKFSSMILHDIRNPLSILRGYGELIQVRPENEKLVAKYAQNIVRESDRLNDLASELLDYSRGEIRLDVSVVSLSSLLKDLEERVRERLRSKGITLEIRNDVEELVLLDHNRLLRVLANLVDNARKAMPRGGKIALEVSHGSSGWFRLKVADTGEGMKKEVLERIFEPFYSSSREAGTGLGMVIVKQIVEAHEGSIVVESEPRKGTTVLITLPLKN